MKRVVSIFIKLAELIAEFPLDVSVASGAGFASLTIRPHERDFAKLIGGHGQIHLSMTAIGKLMGQANGFQFIYNSLQEPNRTEPRLAIPASAKGTFLPNPNWPRGRIALVLKEVAEEMFGGYVTLDSTDIESAHKTIFELIIEGEKLNALEVASIQIAMDKVFDAIGRRVGRKLQVVLTYQRRQPEPPQPKSADGRYARTKQT